MDPLRAFEDLLGVVDSWPTYVTYNIFVEVPSPRSVKKVAAFMYGNGFPSEIAVEDFNACSGQLRSFVSHDMDTWYSLWDTNLGKHRTEYYSMFFKKRLKINGEVVWPEVTVMEFGIESTGCTQTIKSTIDHVRSCKE